MDAPCLSVVIPTYNRKRVLRQCLQALANQTVTPESFEVLVVDDGSMDGTLEALATWERTLPYALRPLSQPNQGPAAARNRGLTQARGTWTLFLGDDILATPHLVEHHLASHAADPGAELAVLGFVTWDPALRVTPLMRWLEASGVQFAYSTMRDGEPVPPGTLYSCNVSFDTRFLRRYRGFNEAFRRAAWEDSELQYRLEEHGLQTRYNVRALAYHHHPTGLTSFARRCFVTGYEAGRAHTLHPDRVPLTPLPCPSKLRAMRRKAPVVTALALLANYGPSFARTDKPFWWLLDHYFWIGRYAWEAGEGARSGRPLTPT
jgi:glycosyltransferase involved in cell wall biosynthesis